MSKRFTRANRLCAQDCGSVFLKFWLALQVFILNVPGLMGTSVIEYQGYIMIQREDVKIILIRDDLEEPLRQITISKHICLYCCVPYREYKA